MNFHFSKPAAKKKLSKLFTNPNLYLLLLLLLFLLNILQCLGVGIGTVFGSLMTAYARNPSLKQQLFSYAVLGFALAEAMGLFCLMIAFLLLFAF